MQYSIYIPGKSGANPEHLRSVGLGALLEPGDASPCYTDITGPDGRGGVLIDWFRAGQRPAWESLLWDQSGYDPAINAKGVFWFGHDGQKIKPDELNRSKRFPSINVTLDDGQVWSLPRVSELPHRLVMDDETGVVGDGDIKQQWRDFYDLTIEAIDTVMRNAEQLPSLTFADFDAFLMRALSVNYRFARPLTKWVSLFANSFDNSEANFLSVVMKLTSLEDYGAAIEFVQKKTEEPTPALALPSDGPLVEQ